MIADVEPDVNSRAGRRNPIPCEYRVGYGPPDERGEIGRPARDVPADGAGDTAGFAFTSAVTGGRVPREYVRAFEAGCRDALVEGPLGGHPVTGVLVRLVDGATHPNDSSELAFRVAGRLGLRRRCVRARWGCSNRWWR